jgi:hypothetical protein
MPEIDSLMQEWPPEVEMALQDQGLPPPDLDCSLESYVDLICGREKIYSKNNSNSLTYNNFRAFGHPSS